MDEQQTSSLLCGAHSTQDWTELNFEPVDDVSGWIGWLVGWYLGNWAGNLLARQGENWTCNGGHLWIQSANNLGNKRPEADEVLLYRWCMEVRR